MMPMLERLRVVAVALVMAGCAAAAHADGVREIHVSRESFDTVKTFIEEALTSRGLVVNNVSHIGDMLERTGKDLGATRQVYLKAEAIEFCSASLSRRMMEADPHNIVFCPYVIAIYVLPEQPDRTYVAFRRPAPGGSKASREALKEVEQLLRGIVREALQ